MTTTRAARRFPRAILASIRDGKILGIRAGMKPHRTIGIWAVVVNDRVFVRSWTMKPNGWYHTFLDEPRGTVTVDGREIPVRAVRTRSETLKDAVSLAYKTKYDTPGSVKYVRGFARGKRREATLELTPAKR
jgi:hypothetical protein